MFIRPYFRKVNGTRRAYWALVESYRSERGPRQRVVAWLGQLDEAGRLAIKQAAQDERASAQQTLFPEPQPRYVEVDVSKVRVENCREFGGPWLALELIKRLGLDEFLGKTLSVGRENVPWSTTALVLIVARLCELSSELSIAENFYRKTASRICWEFPRSRSTTIVCTAPWTGCCRTKWNWRHSSKAASASRSAWSTTCCSTT